MTPGLGRSSGGGHGNPLPSTCLQPGPLQAEVLPESLELVTPLIFVPSQDWVLFTPIPSPNHTPIKGIRDGKLVFEQLNRYIDVVTEKRATKEKTVGTSLTVGWLRLHAPKCTGSILGRGTKFPHPTWHPIETNFKELWQ